MSAKEPRAHANEHMRTSFANSGRIAGAGINYDRYDDESGYRPRLRERGAVRLPFESLSPEELNALNGPVRIYKMSKEGLNEQT